MVDDGFANRLLRRPLENGQKIVAILTLSFPQWMPDHSRRRGHEIGEADQLITDRARFDLARPAHEKWHPMPRLMNVCLLPTPIGIRFVARFFNHPLRPMRAVV